MLSRSCHQVHVTKSMSSKACQTVMYVIKSKASSKLGRAQAGRCPPGGKVRGEAGPPHQDLQGHRSGHEQADGYERVHRTGG